MANKTKFKQLKKFSTPQLLALGGLLAAAGIYLVFFASASQSTLNNTSVAVDIARIVNGVRSQGPETIYVKDPGHNNPVSFAGAWDSNSQLTGSLGNVGCRVTASQNGGYWGGARYDGKNQIPYVRSGKTTVSGLYLRTDQKVTNYSFYLTCYQNIAGQEKAIGTDLLEVKVCKQDLNYNLCEL